MKKVNSSQFVFNRSQKQRNNTVKTTNYQLSTKNCSGQIIIVGIIFLSVVLVLASSLFNRVSNFMNFSSSSIINEQANNLAEAGIEKAIWQLNQTAGSYTGEADTTLGATGTFTVTITNKNSSLKTITATGFVPSSTKPRAKRTIKVDATVDSTQISFHYAVQVGTGGINMQNSSIINGSVYTLGNITGSGSSIINGDAYAVGTISSPDPTILKPPPHPNQTNPPDMPTIDYQFWKDEATAGGVTNCGGTCTFSSGTPNLGPQKYIGNLTLQNTAAAVMNGPIYVTGNITVQNSASLKLNNSFGSNGSVLITDGKVSTQNSGSFLPTCTNPPTCSTPNPKGYILVVTTSTAIDAIKVQNSGVNAIFYALAGGADLVNTAQVTALIANRLEMENTATLNYDQGLANANFTSGPGASWIMKKGTYKNFL